MKYPEWAEFCAQQDLSRLPRHVVKSWLGGKARPTLPGTRDASELLGITERECLAAAGYGQHESTELATSAREDDRRSQRRMRFRLDETFRARDIALKRARRREITQRKFEAGLLTDRVKVRLGLIPSIQTPEHKLAKSREYHRRERERGYVRPENRRPWSAKRIRYEIQLIKWKLRDLERRLSKKWQPWHAYGFWSSDAWVASGSAEAREWQLKDWQVTTQKRRAKEAQAVGSGVTAPEWHAIMQSWGYCCAYCGRTRKEVRDISRRMDLEIEHVVPMPLGPNMGYNIVPACKACNSSKSDGDVIEWAAAKELTLHPRVIEIHRLVLSPKRQLACQ